MKHAVWAMSALVLVCSSCDDGGANNPAASAAATASAAPRAEGSAVASASVSAAPSASATSAPDDPCKKHGLALGGTGTKADRCKVEGDILTSEYAGTIEEEGAVIAITNPWDEEINRLTAAVYYYGADGKQLTLTVDGKETRAARVEDVVVKLPGGKKKTSVKLGPARKDLPADIDTVEVQILGFGWDLGDGNAAYFASTKPFRQYRAVRGGDGPTGIAACDAYRQLLESCPRKLPDALTAMRKSLRDYNNAAPETQKKLAEGLEKGCVDGTRAAKDRCTPD